MEFSHALAGSHQFPRIIAFDRIPPSSSQMIANSGRYNSYEGSQPRVGDAWASHYASKLALDWNYRLLSQTQDRGERSNWDAESFPSHVPFPNYRYSSIFGEAGSGIENLWPSLWKMAACLTVSASRLGHGRIANTGRWILCNWGYLDR